MGNFCGYLGQWAANIISNIKLKHNKCVLVRIQLVCLAQLIVISSAILVLPQNANALVNTTIPKLELSDTHDSNLGSLDRVRFFDITGDGLRDIIISPFSGTVTGRVAVYINNGDGTFANQVSYDTTAYGATRFQGSLHADVDGDDDIDFVSTGVGGSNNVLFTNDGTGAMSLTSHTNSHNNAVAPTRFPADDYDPDKQFGHYADLDGDTDLDYILLDYASASWSTYIYDSGNYSENTYIATYSLGSATATYGTALADIDGDTDYDLIQTINGASAGTSVSTHVWENDGSGNFTEVSSFISDPTRGVSSTPQHTPLNVDSDIDVDLLMSGYESGNYTIYHNDGANNYSSGQTINAKPGIKLGSSWRDVNGDSHKDIILSDSAANESLIYLNDGNDNFVYSETTKIALKGGEDFNRDGQADINSFPGSSGALGSEIKIQFGVAPYEYDDTVYTLFDYGQEFAFYEVDDFNGDSFYDLFIMETTHSTGSGDENAFRIYTNTDNDDDGVSNTDELAIGSDSTNPDSDGDGISDLEEFDRDGNSLPDDTDGDGIYDAVDTDSDNDGVLDVVEIMGPNNGDINNDAISDVLQASVASVPNLGETNYVGLILDNAEDCRAISRLELLAESDLSTQNTAFEFPIGLFDFEIECLSNGGVASLTFVFDDEYPTEDWEWRKYVSETNEFIGMGNQVTFGTQVVGGKTVTIATMQLTDGSSLDDDGISNSKIVDPSGPAVGSALADTGSRYTYTSAFVGATLITIVIAVGSKKTYYQLPRDQW